MASERVLDSIKGPEDLAALDKSRLERLAAELRERIVEVVGRNGGHLASNLGVVELSIALHRVFRSPEDKIVWDVGHQCYSHKLLTGRDGAFDTLRRAGGMSGFPKTSESPHDAFDTGHSSTSVSAALGLLAGARLTGQGGTAVAVIGDGALTGGLAYEGLSNAGQLGLPLVVVLNDNKMSIGPNVGALSKHLSRLTMKRHYQYFRRKVDRMLKGFPFVGAWLFHLVDRLKKGVKAIFFQENFFVDLGFEYVGPIDGHNLEQLEEVLADAKALAKPVVVHVTTVKGKGYGAAERDPASFHGVPPRLPETGNPDEGEASGPALAALKGGVSFTEAFGAALVDLARDDGRIVAITAAMEKGTGLAPFRKAYPERFFDVGIAEQHAVTFAAGLAARGLRPVVAIYSTFAQRAADQIIHDVALQDLPVTFALDRSGFVGEDGETHQGLFDLSMFRGVPNLAVLTPATAVELAGALRWSFERGRPCLIRYPKGISAASPALDRAPLVSGRGAFAQETGAPTCLVFTGGLLPQALGAAELLRGEGLDLDLYAARFLKPLDEDHLASVLARYRLVVVAEEGASAGGLGELVSTIALGVPNSGRALCLSAPDEFPAQATREQLIAGAGLDAASLASTVGAAIRAPGRMAVLRPAR